MKPYDRIKQHELMETAQRYARKMHSKEKFYPDGSVAQKLCRMLPYLNEEAALSIGGILADHPELGLVGLPGMVVIPDADNMTDDMEDATRRYHLLCSNEKLYYCDDLYQSLTKYHPWVPKHLGILRKGGTTTKSMRAQVCHNLTVAAFYDPEWGVFPKEPRDGEVKPVNLLSPFCITNVRLRLQRKNAATNAFEDNPSHMDTLTISARVYPDSVELRGEQHRSHSVTVVRADFPKSMRNMLSGKATLKVTFMANIHGILEGYHTHEGLETHLRLLSVGIESKKHLKPLQSDLEAAVQASLKVREEQA